MKTIFEVKGKDLFINGHKVLKAWESFSGWYWFAVKRSRLQDSVVFDSQGRERVIENDVIWFGLVQGLDEEWGEFSQGEIEGLYPKTWPIPKSSIPHSGRR